MTRRIHVFSRHFRKLNSGSLWRNATLVWRYSWIGALLSLSSVSGQTLAPIGITASQSVPTANGQTVARLGPAGSIYLGGLSGPAPTKSYGDISKTAYYVSRLDASGKTIFTTALGSVTPAAMHIDFTGNVFVSGIANSTGFYTSPGAYLSSAAQNGSRFVCKLSGTDGSVVYCTYLDSYGNAGRTDGIDQQGDFVSAAGQVQFGGMAPPTSHGSLNLGSGHIYVTKLNPAGSALIYSAAFGGSGADSASAVTFDAAGNIYIAGFTSSPDFPTTPHAVVTTITPSGTTTPTPSFLAKLSADGTTLLFSTLGPSGETPSDLLLDSANDPQVLYTNTGALTSGIRRYNTDASAILFDASSYLTSVVGPQLGAVMAVDATGNTTLVFPVSTIAASLLHPTGTCQFTTGLPFPAGGSNGFFVRFDPSGNVQQASYLTQTASSAFDDIAANGSSLTVAEWNGILNVGNPFFASASSGTWQLLTLAPAPEVGLACIGNSASLLASPLVAGEIVSLFGQGIGPTQPIVGVPAPIFPGGSPLEFEWGIDGYQYPTALGTTSVTFDGVLAPLLYVSSTQVNAVVPFGTKSPSHVCITYFFNQPTCMDALLVAAAPGIFTLPATPGAGAAYAAAVNEDGTINSATNPAARGSIITIFATGLGPLSSTPTDGDTVLPPLLTQTLTFDVESSPPSFQDPYQISTPPVWIGQAPYEIAGLSQVNLTVPQFGNEISLQTTIAGNPTTLISSQPVQIWVK